MGGSYSMPLCYTGGLWLYGNREPVCNNLKWAKKNICRKVFICRTTENICKGGRQYSSNYKDESRDLTPFSLLPDVNYESRNQQSEANKRQSAARWSCAWIRVIIISVCVLWSVPCLQFRAFGKTKGFISLCQEHIHQCLTALNNMKHIV